MELSHRFTVPTPVEETWAHFQDIAQVAECFPGAQVTDHDEESFHGSVKVKLGPIALQYNGSGTFVEKDEAAHRFVVDAKGKDKRGNGTAGAKVTLAMSAAASGGTDVSVDTDLAITGKPAQFGRGVMQDVSDKLLGQFVACLEQRLGSSAAAAGPQSVAAPEDDGAGPAPADPAPVPGPETGAGAASPPSAVDVPVEPVEPPEPVAPVAPAAPAPATAQAKGDDAINLGSTVLPILAKNYWKQGLGLVVIVAIIVILFVAL
ncbi:MAG TPA: SRPBCC family protein [Nocardioides sp.]|uniref:SRPBCC family protein n=1 Tax=Nocardioides sp. TaxID=35761 RepID=UPI002E31DCCA|nr:SRPBCC family protein [Nocardioides sp.]HEX5089539.1 SRPBCC family protein [Nocardioides sp.]